MPHTIIGTAGHIDHGKSALVTSITGVNPDRLLEEQRRHITIDLGFAFLDDTLAFVDVPGHEKFVRNMVAGATGIDAAMLVIAADDGIMPQTREHLDILQLLGVRSGLVALTKIDAVEDDWQELVQEEITDFLRGTFLESAPVYPVSNVTGEGIPELTTYLQTLAGHTRDVALQRPFRMPIDRAFTIKGFGTVVTGSVLSGALTAADAVDLMPAGIPVRIRNLQTHGQNVDRVQTGERAAVNFQGIDKERIQRGDVLAARDDFIPTNLLDIQLRLLSTAEKPLAERERVRLHIGTQEVMARVHLYQDGPLLPGDRTYAQLRLESPTVTAVDDHYVLRRYSPAVTIGGGIILDADPLYWRRRRDEAIDYFRNVETGDPVIRVTERLRQAGRRGISALEVMRAVGLSRAPAEQLLTKLVDDTRIMVSGSGGTVTYCAAEIWHELRNTLIQGVREYHRFHPDKPGIPRGNLDQLVGKAVTPPILQAVYASLYGEKILVEGDGVVADSNFTLCYTEDQQQLMAQVREYIEQGEFQPPGAESIGRQLDKSTQEIENACQWLVQQGDILRLDQDIYMAPKIVEQAQTLVYQWFDKTERLGISDFRALLKTSRKFALPLMKYFDNHGITIRDGDERILMPQ